MTAKEKDKDKEKEKKPIIKVEEIEEDVEEEKVKDDTTSTDEPEKEEEAKTTAPAVASFSQLDSAPPSPPIEKASDDKAVSEKEPTEEKPSKPAEEEAEKDEASEDDSTKKEQISSDEVKEWLKEVRPDTTKEVEKGRGPGGKIIVLIVIILFILGAVVGGILYFQKGVSETTPQETPATQAPEETQTPTPFEEEGVDLSLIKISVLNGSGIAGEAGKIKDLLVDSGFSDENINTGNADSYDYEDISISLKGEMSEEVADAIGESLFGYVITISEDELQESSTYDAVIIVGK
jgi:hypothetical protein